MRPGPLLLGLSLAGGCGGARDAACTTLPVQASIEGARDIPVEELRRALAELDSVAGGPLAYYDLQDERLPDAVQLLTDAHRDRGWADATVTVREVALARDRSRVRVVLAVDAGPRFRVGRVRIVELDALGRPSDAGPLPFGVEPEPRRDPATPTALPGLASGQWFSPSRLEAAVETIRATYAAEGYGSVTTDVREERHVGERLVDLAVTIERGPRQRRN